MNRVDSPNANVQFDWKIHGLYPRLKQHLDSTKSESGEEEDEIETDVSNSSEDEDIDLDLPLVAFENVARKLPTQLAPRVNTLRRIVSHLDQMTENHQPVLQELQELRQEFDNYREQTSQAESLQTLQTLRANNEKKREKIRRLENLLLSVARNHPYSESFWMTSLHTSILKKTWN